MAHPFSGFLKFIGTDFEPYILPIIPVGAKLIKESNLTPDHLGKIPGIWSADQRAWMGFKEWPKHYVYAKAFSLRHWQHWQPESGTAIAVGMNTHVFNVVDIDSDNPDIADFIETYAAMYLGLAPAVRLRFKSARRVLVYERDQHTAPIQKHRLAFKDATGAEHAVEFLARGQQVVIEGPHAKGQMHHWRNGGLIENRETLRANLITADMVDCLFRALGQWVEETEGLERIKLTLPGGGNCGIAVKVELSSKHVALDKKMLANAIKAIDINHPRLDDYDSWCLLFRAMWAACGGDRAFYIEHMLPWLLANPENKEEDMEAKLASFHDSMHGADFVYERAAEFGFMDGVNARVQSLFKDSTPPGDQSEDVQDSAVGASSIPATASSGSDQNGGGGGPVPPDDTHWKIAEAFITTYGARWRYNVDAKRWFTFDDLIWRPSDTILETLGGMMAAQAAGILQRVNGRQGEARYRALMSMGNIASVRNLLQGRTEMIVNEVDFDAHPHLLNTPAGVIDLRTGAMSDPHPSLLIRQITLVAPDIDASTWMNGRAVYEQRCPLFFKVLRNVAAGREWVIPAIRAWFAYCLTGDLRHQALMFMHGPPGVGKTQIVEVLFALLNTYAFLIDESFLSKNGGEAKRFDIANIVGKRMLFMDETQLGMTWDETRASKGASAKKLSAEIKFGRTIQFCNTAKICIVGNHKPNFVAAETGGLTSRMLLFEAQGIDYRDPKNGGTDNLADIIVRDEGPAVMMWALEACVADYCTPGLFSELTAEPREAARQYAQEDSTIRQWADDLMRVTPDADIDQMEAFRAYLSFAKEISSSGKAPNIKLSGFKQALKATFPSIEFANRTKGLHKNRVFIKGFGFRQPDFNEGGNVV